MNIKNKIIAVLLMSLLVFGFGFTFLYKQYVPEYNTKEIVFVNYNEMTPQIIPPVKPPKNNKNSFSSQQNQRKPIVSGTFSSPRNNELFSVNTITSTNIKTELYNNSYSYVYNYKKEDETLNFGNEVPMILAFEGGSSRTSYATSENYLEVINTGLISAPLSVPFMGGNSTNQALVDPGARETNLQKIVPVGEGCWILVLCTCIYMFYRRRY